MDRRNFLVAAGAAAALGVAGKSGAAEDKPNANSREFYELRKYIPPVGPRKKILDDYLKNAAIPAWKRQGIGPVGVFTVVFGPNSPSLYVLLPHKSLSSVVEQRDAMAADVEYQNAAKEFLSVPISAPAFTRMESELLRAFAGHPALELPPPAKEKTASRIFELRIYESHSPTTAKKKIQMFNEGGEIGIFKKTGMQPVLFAETIIGPMLPNLHYMLCFENMAQRDERWKAFQADPDWAKLKVDPQYADAVSNITDIVLKPTAYSEL